MTALPDLFPEGPRADQSAAVLDDHHTARRLREMIGDPRDSGAAPGPLADTRELVEMVDAAARTAVPVATDSGIPVLSKRRRSWRIDGLTLTAAAVAVVAMLAAGTVGGIQAATASPASSALESLEADEAAVQNAYQSLKTARERLLADVEAQSAEVELVRSALIETSSAPDPAGALEGTTLSISDDAALRAALAALETYAAGLASFAVPELPTEYARADIDEDSLVAVGGAIDRAQECLVMLDEATAEARGLRSQLDALRPPAELAMDAYAASFAGAAGAAVARYPDGAEPMRTAVLDGAARIGAVDLWAPDGRSALLTYRDAFVALATDQLRVEIEREQDEGAAPPRRQQNGTQTSPPGGSTDPTPVDPVVPVDPMDPVDPVDPETPPESEGTP